ncbi:4-hydroxybenzoyl-CoA thioesterase [Rhodocyclaceae bacterium]|mgnify:FL=1|jgi:acyl-CoA thioester hydrolase|nr:4-hydroxybenzoyl-CoA thioesterase [Rhodocyclaceae bacterium]
MEHKRKLIYATILPIRWGDMDAMNHVNNTVYFRYMEQARIEWLESLGYGTGQHTDEGPVIVNAGCTYLVPLVYPGNVEVRMFIGHPGRSSLPTHYELRLQGNEKLYATGDAKMVWINPASGRSIPLPGNMRALAEEE